MNGLTVSEITPLNDDNFDFFFSHNFLWRSEKYSTASNTAFTAAVC